MGHSPYFIEFWNKYRRCPGFTRIRYKYGKCPTYVNHESSTGFSCVMSYAVVLFAMVLPRQRMIEEIEILGYIVKHVLTVLNQLGTLLPRGSRGPYGNSFLDTDHIGIFLSQCLLAVAGQL